MRVKRFLANAQLLRQIIHGHTAESATDQVGDGESSMPPAATSPKRSSVSHKTDAISPTARESLFGLIPARKSTGSQGLSERLAGKIWKARKSVAPTAAAITPAFLKIPPATNWKFVAAKIRSLPGSKTHSPA